MKAKNLIKTSLGAGVLALALGFANPSNAATQSWNPGGAGGGSGAWNLSNWDSAAAWTSGNTATFAGTAGTVDLSTTTQTVGGLTFNVGAYTLSNGTLALNGAPTTITTTSGTTTFASNLLLAGAGGIAITKTGAGTLALIANNSGLGTGASPAVWTVTGGTLSSGVYSSALSVAAGTCLGAVPTTGTVQVILDAGTLIAANNVASNRWIQVNAAGGTLQLNMTQSVDGKIFNSADASHTLYAGVGSGFTGSLTGVISGNGSLTKIDAGTLTLTGNNTYTGLTSITAGKLNLGSALALGGGGNITFSGGTASLQYSAANTADYSGKILNSTSAISIDTNSQNVTFASTIGATNTGGLTKSGAGTLTLSGNNSYTGGTTIAGGTIAVGNNGAFGTGNLTINDGGTLANNDTAAHTLTNSVTTVSGTTNGVTFTGSQDLTLSNGLNSSSAAVKLTKTGASTLTLTTASNVTGFQLGGTSAATAAVWTIAGGTLDSTTGVYSSILNTGIVGGQALGNNPGFTNNGAQIILDQGTLNTAAQFNAGRTLQVNAAGGTMENATGGGTTTWLAQILNNADSGHTFYLYAPNAMGISGVISGAGSLTKTGANTLTLSGANTYTGATILNQGTLTVGTGGTLGASTAALSVNNTNSTAAGNAAILNLAAAVDTTTGSLSGTIATPTSGTNTATINTQTGRNFTVNQTVSGTYAGVIAGAGTFTKTGSAPLTLTGINTYTGNTTISAGALSIATTSALPGWDTGGKYSVASGATLAVYNAVTSGNITTMLGTGNFAAGAALGFDTTTANRTYSAVLANTGSGALGLTKLGANTLILDQTNTYTGTTTISSGTLQIGSGTDAGSISATSSISNAGSLVYNVGGGSRTLGAVISGNGTLTQNSSGGTLVLTANNTYTGNTTISAGTLQVGNGADAGSISATSSISNAGSLVYNVGSGSRTLGAVISGNGTLTQNSSGGTLVLTANNTYTGNTTISAGTLQVGNGTDSGSIGSSVGVANEGALVYNVGAGNRTAPIISGNGSLTQSGTGVLHLNAANTFKGGVTVNSGTLGITAGSSLGSPATTTFAGNGTLQFENTLGAAVSAARLFAINSGATATIDTQSYNGTVASLISGSGGSLAKSGTGVLSLSANNTYTGATTVTAGTLILSGTNSTSGVSVALNAILGGSGKVAGALSGAGQVGPGSSPGILTATQVNPTGGLGFAFEFTQTGGPIYGSATASGNDVLHLNNATTPFTANLTGSNAVGIYLNLTTVAANDVFQGGFFTDKSVSFLSSINSAAFSYYVKGNGGGSHAYNGFNYYTLAEYNAGFSINLSTVQVGTAAFADGTVSGGYISEISVVPEPSTWALLAFSLTTVMVLRRRRD